MHQSDNNMDFVAPSEIERLEREVEHKNEIIESLFKEIGELSLKLDKMEEANNNLKSEHKVVLKENERLWRELEGYWYNK